MGYDVTMVTTVTFQNGKKIWFETGVPEKLSEALQAYGPTRDIDIVFKEHRKLFLPGIKNKERG